MAVPSRFLQGKTKYADNGTDREDLRSSLNEPLGGGGGKPVTRASGFLAKKAAERRAGIDKKFGREAYGGSAGHEEDLGAGFQSWLSELGDFSSRMSGDWTKRDGAYQEKNAFEKYRNDTFAELALLENRANTYRNFFSDNRELYGDETVSGILSALDDGTGYLKDVRDQIGSELDYWSLFENEAEYNDYQRALSLDPDEAKAEIERLSLALAEADKERANARDMAEYANTYGTPEWQEQYSDELDEKNARYDEIRKQRTDLQRVLGMAENIRENERYNAYLNEGDFAQYSAQGAGIANPSFEDAEKGVTIFGKNIGGKKPGNIVTYSRDNWRQIAFGEGSGSQMTGSSLYRFMTDDEVGIYNYLLAKEGAAAAQEYLNHIEETLNYRAGQSQGRAVRDEENGLARTGLTALYGIAAGADQFKSGAAQLFSKERLPTSAVQFGSGYIRDDLAGTGPKVLGSSLGQMAYDAVTTTANMAPSILLSSLTAGLGAPAAVSGAVGSAALGASAGGNAYNAALQEGYAPEEARNYALLTGASEGALQYVLGGIGKLGGKLTGSVAQNTIKNIDNALLRTAAELGIHMAGEGFEEYLQEVLEPVYRNLFFDENNEIKLVSEEAAYSFLLGALTAGLMEGGHIAANNVNLHRTGAFLKNSGKLDMMMEQALALDPDTEAHKLAADLRSGSMKATEINVGQLVNAFLEAGGSMKFIMDAPKAEADVQATAESTAAEALLAEAAAQAAERGSVSNSMAERILADEGASSALGVAVDDSMTKSQQRAAVKSAVAGLTARESVTTGSEVSADTSAPKNAVQRAQAGAEANADTQSGSMGTGKAGRQVLRDMYNPAVPVTEYYAEMDAYYQAGMRGEDAANVQSGGILTVQQQEAAYLAGLADGANGTGGVAGTAEPRYTNLDNKLEGATASDGKTAVYLRDGSQRNGGAYPGGQVSAVESGAGQNSLRTVRGRPADGETARLSYGERVSTASLGIGGGSTKASIRLVTGGETTSTKAAKQLARERGLRLVLFAGDNLNIKLKDGTVVSVRGMYVTGDRVFVRVDHPRYTADQLMRHEAGHDAVEKGEVDTSAVKERLADLYGEDYVEKIATMYEQAYRGSGVTAENVWEECICDSLGDMNVFDDAVQAELADEFLPRVKQAVQDVRGKNDTTRGPPSAENGGRFSRQEYSGHQVEWAVNNGVITEQERVSFFHMIANISKLGDKVRRTKDGGYIVDLGNKLLFTDANWKSPSLSSVVVFGDVSETSMRIAKDVIFNGESGKAGYEKSRQIIEDAYWPGYVERYTEQNSSAYAREDTGRKGADSGADYERTGNSVNENFSREVSADAVDESGEFFEDTVERFSREVTDEDVLAFLEKQDTITTYKTMQIVDGNLYPPMASRINGKFEDASVIGKWEEATEHPELIKGSGKFKLDKGKGQGSIEAAYNPYMHSSNLVLNDQFSGAYKRDNLVTVECEVPVSEVDSGYHAEFAKDSVGWHPWHTGTVAGQLRKTKGIERQVFLSRWIKPVRIVPDAEVAAMYKDLLSGTDVAVPDNVVTPSLLNELQKAGVPIEKSGRFSREGSLTQEQADRLTSYNALVSRPDMTVTEIDDTARYTANSQTRKALVQQAIKNAAAIGKTDSSGGVSVHVDDIGRDVLLSKHGLQHGLDRRLQDNAAATLNAGGILKNAVLINKLTPQNQNASDSYVLLGAAKNKDGALSVVEFVVNSFSNEVTSVDVLYSANAKKEPAVLNAPAIANHSLRITGSTISIARLLDFARDHFPDVLPESVLRHYGFTERPGGRLGESALFSREAETGRPETREAVETELMRENKRLREQVEYWKGQTKRTTAENRTVRADDVKRLAQKLKKSYSGKADITAQLQELGNSLVRGAEYAEVKDKASGIARKLLDSAEVLNDEAYRAYADMRDYLRKTRIVLGDMYYNDIPDFSSFRKRYMGKLNLAGHGATNVDQVYAHMAELWPEFFDDSRTSHPTDQLLEIAEVLDSLVPIMENPFSYDMATAVEIAANDIIDGLLEDVRQTPKTYADRQALQAQKQTAKLRRDAAEQREAAKKAEEDALLAGMMHQGAKDAKALRLAEARHEQQMLRLNEILKSVRENRDQRIKALKQHYADMAKLRRERTADSKARTRLLKIVRRLQNKKLPAVNRALLDEYIAEIDTVAKSLTDGKAKDLAALRDWYEDQRDNNPDFIAEPAIEKAISRLGKKQISDMTAEDVAELTNVLLNIENEIRTQRKLIDSQDRRDTYAMGLEVIEDVGNTAGSKTGILGIPGRYIVTETLSPLRQVRRMTGYVDSDPLNLLTNALADGQRKMFDYQRRAGEAFLKWTKDKKLVDTIAGKNAQEIEVQGIGKDGIVKVKITPAMRMSLYLHSKNSQNMRHIAGGGVTVPDIKLYKQGKIAEAYARGTTIKLTPSEVRSITKGMSAKEKAFADAAHAYFNGMSQAEINAVSEKLKGYSLAGVEDYFPINTDTSFAKTDFEALKFDGTIEGMGFLKERVNSSAPILLRDMNAVLTQSIDNTAKYVGLAIPVRNFNKVWGVTKTSYDAEGNRSAYESSVQQAIKQKWGEDGYRYIENMMKDLNNGRPSQDNWANVLNRIKSNYAGAVLTLNASVAMKQAASYPTAGAVLGFKPLARAMADFGKVDLDLINKYTPLQWYRSQGFSTQELGDMAKRNKSLPKALNWIQGIDLLTTRKLWKASEYYVRDNRRDLSVGTNAYYEAVAEVYNRVIEETQPNYTTMQRPQLLRSENSLLQSLSMFKTQPFQNFNILYDAIGELAARERAYRNTGTQEARVSLDQARQRAAWAVTSQVMSLAVFSGMTFAWNMFRGKLDNYEDDEEDEMTPASVLARIGKDMVGGAAGMVPFGSDVWELASSKIFGEKYYGMDAVTVQALADSVTALGKIADISTAAALKMSEGEAVDWNEVRLQMDRQLDALSKGFGVPYENVNNLFNAVYLQSAKAVLGDLVGTYSAMKLTTSRESYSSDYYDLLYKAYTNDNEAYGEIYADMVKSGFSEDKIRNAMESRMKKAQGVRKVSELENRWLSPKNQARFDGTMQEVRKSGLWKSATEEQRDKAEEAAYDLAAGNSAGKKMQESIDGGEAFGITEPDYILFELALRMADKPTEKGNYGSYTNDEVETAIDMLRLNDSASSYLWLAQGGNEKSNPYQ